MNALPELPGKPRNTTTPPAAEVSAMIRFSACSGIEVDTNTMNCGAVPWASLRLAEAAWIISSKSTAPAGPLGRFALSIVRICSSATACTVCASLRNASPRRSTSFTSAVASCSDLADRARIASRSSPSTVWARTAQPVPIEAMASAERRNFFMSDPHSMQQLRLRQSR